MIKNKLLITTLFSFSLASFSTTQADTNPEPAIAVNNAIEKLVTSLCNNKITYNYRTQTVRIYPELHCLGTTLFGIALLILGMSVLTDERQGERVSSVAFGWILNYDEKVIKQHLENVVKRCNKEGVEKAFDCLTYYLEYVEQINNKIA